MLGAKGKVKILPVKAAGVKETQITKPLFLLVAFLAAENVG